MVTTTERQAERAELVSQGYAWEYIKEWQPKITLYRHAPGMDMEGNEAFPVGTPIKGLPGNPDYVRRKGRLGMLPSPPSASCECKWCVARRVHAEPVTDTGEEFTDEESIPCHECGEQVAALTKSGALSRMRVHMKTHQLNQVNPT